MLVKKMKMLPFALQIVVLCFLTVEGKSISSTSVSCGNPQFKDSWLVELRVKHSQIDQFCYGAMISDQHVLTTSECLWLLDTNFGGARATFPSFPEISFIPLVNPMNATNRGSPWPGLLLFQLQEKLVVSNFSSICLSAKNNSPSCEEEGFLCPLDQDCDEGKETIRRPGFPVVSAEKDDGKLYLQGLRANTCSSRLQKVTYIDINAYRQWIQAAVLEEASVTIDTVVNGLCPLVRKISAEDTFSTCDKPQSFPGIIRSSKSKVFCSRWDLVSIKADSVELSCNDYDDGDGEILELSKSEIVCRVVDCLEEKNDSQEVPLSNLVDCPAAAASAAADDNTQETGDDNGCVIFSNSFNGDTFEDNTESPLVLVKRTQITFTPEPPAEITEEEMDGLSSCETEDAKERCQFPFLFEGRFRFECVKRNGENSRAECLLDGNRWEPCGAECPLMKYHSHGELISDLESIQNLAGDELAQVFSLGTSVLGANLTGIRLFAAENEAGSSTELRPLVKLVGNMHGNEPTGRELLIHLAKNIVLARLKLKQDHYKQDPLAERLAKLLATTDLWILPTMNPDGFARGTEGKCFGSGYTAGRANEAGVDLNRDFPSWTLKGRKSVEELKLGRAKETQLVMDWILEHPFVLSANFHDGAVLANYPYDDYRSPASRQAGGVSRTPDHDVFVHLAKAYTANHPWMEDTTQKCPHWGFFKDGITNGADWYEVKGGMQDFNYDYSNAMEITVEVSCCKYSERSRLLDEWNANMVSLIAFVEQAQRGLRGFVRDNKNNAVSNAQIQVKTLQEKSWRGKNVTSDELGRYWRILLPGNYTVRAVKDDQMSAEYSVQINDIYTRIDLILETRR